MDLVLYNNANMQTSMTRLSPFNWLLIIVTDSDMLRCILGARFNPLLYCHPLGLLRYCGIDYHDM